MQKPFYVEYHIGMHPNDKNKKVDSSVTLCKFGCNVSISPLFERLLHKNHLARVRRTSRFGLKYKHGWKCREVSLKNTRSITRNTAANVSTSPSNYSVVSRLQILKPRFKLHPICSLVVCRSLRTKSSSTQRYKLKFLVTSFSVCPTQTGLFAVSSPGERVLTLCMAVNF